MVRTTMNPASRLARNHLLQRKDMGQEPLFFDDIKVGNTFTSALAERTGLMVSPFPSQPHTGGEPDEPHHA